MNVKQTPTTAIGYSTAEKVYVNGLDLTEDVIGKFGFTEFIYLHLTGKRAEPHHIALLDVVLVTLMEHGLTPSAIVTRLIHYSTPEGIQSAVAAGLLGVGSTFIGTMEGCAALLDDILAAPEGVTAHARKVAQGFREQRRAIPGFGHPIHKPDDPRALRMLQIAQGLNVPGRHIDALQELSAAVDHVYGKHLTINATGATAALLGEIAIPSAIMRGVAVISRSAGLVGHIAEEMREPTGKHIWQTVEHAIPYVSSRER